MRTMQRNLAVAKMRNRSENKIISSEHILLITCMYLGVKKEDAVCKTRKREVVQCRQMAMYLSKLHTGEPLAKIGKNIGGKDHATVIHAEKTMINLIETDVFIRRAYRDIEDKIINLKRL